MKEGIKQKLFKRMILRRIYEPAKNSNGNLEIKAKCKLINYNNTINFLKFN